VYVVFGGSNIFNNFHFSVVGNCWQRREILATLGNLPRSAAANKNSREMAKLMGVFIE
jgi:hypothetical protein